MRWPLISGFPLEYNSLASSRCLPTDTRGVPRVDDRRVISGIVHVLQSRVSVARPAPAVYGPPKTLYNRFVRWARKGVWERVFMELA